MIIFLYYLLFNFEMMDPETKFLLGMIELSHGRAVKKVVQRDAQQVPWARGWPEDDIAFWNAEAFMWQQRIPKEKRVLIGSELAFLRSGKNLDLGCGGYSYIPSVGFDGSEKMLQLNEQCLKKVQGSLEEPLPFADASFDSATAVFVLNYVKKYPRLLPEIRRVVKQGGHFVAILSAKGVNDWQQQKVANWFAAARWKKEMISAGFRVEQYTKEGLWFFQCRNG